MGINGVLIMKKQFFLTLLVTLSYFSGSIAMQQGDVPTKPVQLSERVVLGFDLHDTYLKADNESFKKRYWEIAGQAPNLITLIALSPFIGLRGWMLSRKPEYAGAGHDIMDQLAKEFPPLATIKDQILDAIDGLLHKPNPEMVALVKELKDMGYKVIIVSNIAKRGLEGMKAENPDAFFVIDDQESNRIKRLPKSQRLAELQKHTPLFDGEFISDYPRKVAIGEEEIVVPKKPKIEFYRIMR